jgi:hypothetical protein
VERKRSREPGGGDKVWGLMVPIKPPHTMNYKMFSKNVATFFKQNVEPTFFYKKLNKNFLERLSPTFVQ